MSLAHHSYISENSNDKLLVLFLISSFLLGFWFTSSCSPSFSLQAVLVVDEDEEVALASIFAM